MGDPFRHRFQKPPAIPAIFKNSLPPVATVHQVIDHPGILDAQFPSHGQTLKVIIQKKAYITILLTDPFMTPSRLGILDAQLPSHGQT
jgi:hypothetical protein